MLDHKDGLVSSIPNKGDKVRIYSEIPRSKWVKPMGTNTNVFASLAGERTNLNQLCPNRPLEGVNKKPLDLGKIRDVEKHAKVKSAYLKAKESAPVIIVKSAPKKRVDKMVKPS